MSNKKPKINISHIAKLANLPLSTEEEAIQEEQLIKILDYVQKLESADTQGIEPTFNISANNNVTRNDIVNNGLTQDEALQNITNKKDGHIETKGVFNNE